MKKVLIIPFHISKEIEDADYLMEGMVEELIDFISETKGMSTAGRNLSLYLKEHPQSGKELSEQFGVDYLIEGSLKPSGDALAINLRLVDAPSEEVVSSQKKSLTLENWTGQLQQLVVELFKDEHALYIGTHEVQPEKNARELYLKGLYHWNRYTYAEMQTAIGYFAKALKVDPNYALAYAGLANCYSVIAVMGHELPLPAFSKALDFVSKALSMQQQHSEIYICAAFLSIFYEKDFAKAKANLDQALRLNNSNSTTYHLLSYYYAFVQEFETSEEYCLKTLALDPLSIPSYNMMGRLALYKRDFAKAQEIIDSALFIEPTALPILELQGLIYLLTGNLESAIETFRNCVKSAPDQLLFYGYLSYTYAAGQFYTESLAVEQELEQSTAPKNTGNYDHAKAMIRLSRKDYKGFFIHANKALDAGLTFVVGDVNTNPIYSEIRRDKRYEPFMKRANLIVDAEERSKKQRPSAQFAIITNTREVLTLDPQDIAYIRGDGNYCTVYWHQNQLLVNKVLRVTLKQLEAQLQPYAYLGRCHKSFFINFDEPLVVSGNARGHFLESNFFPIRIPVSRAKSAEVKRRLTTS